MKKNFLLFLLYCWIGAEELIYPYREIHTPLFSLAPEVSIIVSSPPRTGSTLVYNILQYLFEDRSCEFSNQGKRVKKTHTLRPLLKENRSLDQTYIFCPLRDPLSQFSSLLRVGKIPNDDLQKHFKHCLKESFYFLRHFRTFPHFSFLIYETFEADFSPIFNAIEKEFSIQIKEKERELIRIFFSKEALSSIAKSMNTFEEADPITGIHGLHISSFADSFSLKNDKELERLSKPLIHTLNRLR
jgi:hypothetical protein